MENFRKTFKKNFIRQGETNKTRKMAPRPAYNVLPKYIRAVYTLNLPVKTGSGNSTHPSLDHEEQACKYPGLLADLLKLPDNS